MTLRSRAFLALAVLGLWAAPATAQTRQEIAAGKAIAQQKCAGCHAVGATGKSRAKAAPPFRTLTSRYNVDDLEEAFVEGVAVRHGDVQMPEFEFSPNATAALIAYIKSVGKTKPR